MTLGSVVVGAVAMLLAMLVALPVALWKIFRFIARRADQRAMVDPPLVIGEPGRVTPALLVSAVAAPLLPVAAMVAGPALASLFTIAGLVAMLSAWVLHG